MLARLCAVCRGTLRSVVKAGGPIGLYAGVGMTLIGSLPFEGIKFGVYDWLKREVSSGNPSPFSKVGSPHAFTQTPLRVI